MAVDLSNMTTQEMLRLHANLMQELTDRKILRTMNNPVAGYGEYLACKALSLTASPNSEKGYDAFNINNEKFEIKCRRITRGSVPTRLSAIRDIEGHHFNFLVMIIFESDFTVKRALQIPYELVCQKAKFNRHVNGWILPVREIDIGDKDTVDLTSAFTDAQK